jgi:MinD-like ATPase involved in chromosome partitioning or flagellar assembly
VTERDSSDNDPLTSPPAGGDDEVETSEQDVPEEPTPVPLFRDRRQPPPDPYGDEPDLPPAEWPGSPPGEYRAGPSEESTAAVPPRHASTDVWPRRDFGPPPFRDEPPPPQGGGRPGWPGPEPGWGGEPPRPPEPRPQQWGGEAPSQWGQEPRGQAWGQEPPAPQWGGEAQGQWGGAPQPRWDRTAPGQAAEPPRWAGPPPYADSPAGPEDWSYVDTIRTSELVPTRKIPPQRGWRRAVLKGTFGLVNLGQSPDERREAQLQAKIRTLLRGRYKIGVLGKGGTGKTTIAAGVGSILAEMRQEDRVVAIDADTAFGKLASRIDPNTAGSYWELAADQHLDTFADVRSRVGANAVGLFVLGGETATARRRVLDPAIYREATSRLDNHFTISIVDCGSTLDSAVTQEVLGDLDALIVVSSPWVDGASTAGQTMEWLANNGYTGLLHRTVVVLNDSDGHADAKARKLLAARFGSRGQVVIEVPYDAHLRPGGVIDVDHDISRETRRRLIEIAAAIAEHFAATTDRPRERR